MFKKGDYIVIYIPYDAGAASFKNGYIYKQRVDMLYLMPELDNKGSTTNGWGIIHYLKDKDNHNWEYANKYQIEAYNKAGKPVSVPAYCIEELMDNLEKLESKYE